MNTKRTLTAFLLLLSLAWSAPFAKADHYSGGSLTYECLGNNFYRFSLDLYLDCTGVPLTPQGLDFSNDCGTVFSVNNLPVVLTEEVSQLCAASLPNSTCNSGVLRGLRHHRLQTTVYLSPCNDWTIDWDICCRSTSVDLFGTPGMYVGATVNNFGGACDQSPAIADKTFPFVCVNQPVLYNPGINDPDRNRMAFELISARYFVPPATPVLYNVGFTGTAPIPGIVLDPLTGQLSFTPTVTGNYVVVMKVTTYNASNAVIGTVMRDFIVVVMNCMGSNPRTTGATIAAGGAIVGANGLEVCHGVPFCLEFPFTDADPGAVLTLTSNATTLLPGATFNVVGTNPAVGVLCWTPVITRSKTNVHFKATDNECPIPNVASKSILITVLPAPTVFPNAGTNGTLALCPNSPPTPLANGLGGTPDVGGTWKFGGVAHGPNYAAGVDVPGVYTYTVVGPSPCASSSSTVTVVESSNGLELEFQSGATNPNAVTYEVLDATGNTIVVSGNNPVPANSTGTQALCLADGCYQLRVTDAGGDGLMGYVLRETGTNGRRIIDNASNMSNGVSQISNGSTFCVPISDVDLIWTSCDKLDWVNNKYLVCHVDPLVSAEWVPNGANNVQDANSGYEFWIFDPNGTYSYRKFRSHNVSDGYSPATANRAAHMKINNWYNTVLTPLIPQNALLNVRVRGRVNGTNLAFGPACTMKMDATRAACPLVKLQDDPADPGDYSCGVTRTFGGPSTGANKITALPPQFAPAPFGGGTGVRFQFRFRIPGEGVCIVRPPQTSAVLYMNWIDGPLLQATKTYEVEVRVSKDLGATWCIDQPSPACDPSPVTTWGKTCNVTISGIVAVQGGSSNMSSSADGSLTLYPNPNNGEQLFMQLSEVDPEVKTLNVDLFDLMGKRVAARTIVVNDGMINTVLDLNNELSNGLYMVNIIAGEKTYTERLVIQK